MMRYLLSHSASSRGLTDGGIFDRINQAVIVVFTHRVFNRISLFQQHHQSAHISRLDTHDIGDFLNLRFAVEVTHQFTSDLDQLVDIVGDNEQATG